MTTLTPVRAGGPGVAPGRAATAAGTLPLLRFALRRERLRIPVWALTAAGLTAMQSLSSQDVYSTPGAMAAYQASVGSSTAIIAISGPPVGLDTIAGSIVFELSTTMAVLVALQAMFTVGRHTRGDEEAGRTELVRSARVGRHAPVLAALAVGAISVMTTGAAVTAAGVGTGLATAGSLVFGAWVAALGLVFAAATAVAAQVTEHARAVYGIVGTVLGVAFVLRAVGDVAGNGLSWLSPLGWAQATHPFTDDRWWPLLLCLAATAVLVLVALALLERRDLGGGLIATRPGPAHASRWLASPLGLAWRLQRAALLGWVLGLASLGAVYGGLASTVDDLIASTPEAMDYFPQATVAGLTDAYLAVTLLMSALLAAGYAIASVLRARSEESAGRAEPVLATAVSRARWLGSHVTVALGGAALLMTAAGASMGASYAVVSGDPLQVTRLTGAALAYLPGVFVLAGVTVAVLGAAPRLSAVVGWAGLAYAFVASIFAESFRWPDWVRRLSPFEYTPDVPAEDAGVVALTVLLGAAAVLLAAGFAAFRRRDIG